MKLAFTPEEEAAIRTMEPKAAALVRGILLDRAAEKVGSGVGGAADALGVGQPELPQGGGSGLSAGAAGQSGLGGVESATGAKGANNIGLGEAERFPDLG